MSKILCPFHEEDTPSCEVYEKDFHCYGCGAHGPLEKLGIEVKHDAKPKFIENLRKAREYIKTLPIETIRGFPFPVDRRGFYILWPDCDYYKLRLFEPGKGAKYKNPSGHSQPPFWVRRQGFQTLYLVEGEINALSVSSAHLDSDVCSPGSASDFTSKKTESLLTQLCNYANIIIVVDRDAAGTIAAIHAKAFCLRFHPKVSIVLMHQDANEILITHGKEALRQEIDRGMSQGL